MKKLCAQQKKTLAPGARVGRVKRRSIKFVEHLTGDGPTVFRHVCRIGLEGIVSKRVDAPYRSGPSKGWLKSKNPASEAVRREREEDSMARSICAVVSASVTSASAGERAAKPRDSRHKTQVIARNNK